MISAFYKDDGTVVLDPLRYVNDWLLKHPKGEIHLGCDSKVKRSYVKYSVAICMREIGRGVHEIYGTKTDPLPKDRYSRLWEEVNLAVKVAHNFDAIPSPIFIHVDLNKDPNYFSNSLYEASVGFIKSMGYNALAKPDAWAASSGAHSHCQ